MSLCSKIFHNIRTREPFPCKDKFLCRQLIRLNCTRQWPCECHKFWFFSNLIFVYEWKWVFLPVVVPATNSCVSAEGSVLLLNPQELVSVHLLYFVQCNRDNNILWIILRTDTSKYQCAIYTLSFFAKSFFLKLLIVFRILFCEIYY